MVLHQEKQVSEEYLLFELGQLYSAIQQKDERTNGKINAYLALLSVFFAVTTLLPQFGHLQTNISNVGACLALGVILLFGLITHAEFVQIIMDLMITNRRISRIRRYFVENYPDMQDYLLHPQYDDRPIVVKRRTLKDILRTDIGFKQILTVLNAIVAGVLSALLTLTFINRYLYLYVIIITSLIVGSIVLFGQMSYSRVRYGLMENKLKTELPLWEQHILDKLDDSEE